MSRRREPDIDFESLMDKQGVTRMDEREVQRRGKAAPLGAPVLAPPPQAGGATAPDHVALLLRAKDEFRRLEAEREVAKVAALEAEARADAAAARAVAAEARAVAAEARAVAAEARAVTAEAHAAAAEARAAAEAMERRKATGLAQEAAARAAAALSQLEEAKVTTPATIRLDSVLERAGIAPAAFAPLVAALAGLDRLGELLRRLQVVPNTELVHFLDDRIAWTCDGCAPVLDGPQRTRVPVRPEDCDVCAGSSIQSAAQRFAQACERAGVTRVLVVGGSPTYHDALQKLAPRLANVKLKLIRGDSARDRQRAGQDLAGVDVAFIWASTVLDHRVGELYRGPKVHTLPIRGIGRMLLEAAKRISGA